MKKRILITLAVVLVLAGAAFGGWKYYQSWYQDTYIIIDGMELRRDTLTLNLEGNGVEELEKLAQLTNLEELDLRGTKISLKNYEMLRSKLPDCRILWDVPFQGKYYDLDTSAITIKELTIGDLDTLSYLKKLQTIHAEGCRDYAVLQALKQSRPTLDVRFTVAVGGQELALDTTELVAENADVQQITDALNCLKRLTRVEFTGVTPDNEQIVKWKENFPQVQFVWNFTVCGVATNSLATELYLNDIPMESVEEVENSLKYFYDLNWVEMCGCGIPSADMDALWQRNPDTRFIWTVKVGRGTLRTDTKIFMPYLFGYDGARKVYDKDLVDLKYCIDIECMDLGHQGVTDCSFLAYMPNMKYLILGDTPCKDFTVLAELKELLFLEIFQTSFDQAEVLTGLTKLEDLNIAFSKIDNIEPLKEMTWLKRLWLPGTAMVDILERQFLREALPDTKIMFRGRGSTDYGWRQSPNYYAMRDMLGMPYYD